ncbi:E3 ubiquitin-protein ligase RING1 [Acorus calamus]|uniref:E3 ubiquitin-protein ligase RING1 n=1 Tax=Acorus calamus TaxID=4465 RepID=A0AAV9D800_ACOCL|nr:E3 ubiquitin-protein ligase RING1 [Acorus calamus]
MAELAELFLLPEVSDDEDNGDDLETLDPSTPYWSPVFTSAADDSDLLFPDFSFQDNDILPEISDGSDSVGGVDDVVGGGSVSDSDQGFWSEYCEDPLSAVFDAFDRGASEDGEYDRSPREDFRVFEGGDEVGSDHNELGLWLGFDEHGDDEEAEARIGGLRIVGFESESEEGEIALPLCWDSFRLEEEEEEDRREAVAAAEEEFEWEEVFDEGHVFGFDRSLSTSGDRTVEIEEEPEEGDRTDPEAPRSLDWEILLAMNSLEDDSFVHAADYDMTFGQFMEAGGDGGPTRGSRPAAQSVVRSLPLVIIDIESVCAVCKDEIPVAESVTKLPCSHFYHGDCILPWLKLKNTCPVCRHELPTDDPDYERWKARRMDVRDPPVRRDVHDPPGHWEGLIRYDFETLTEN